MSFCTIVGLPLSDTPSRCADHCRCRQDRRPRPASQVMSAGRLPGLQAAPACKIGVMRQRIAQSIFRDIGQLLPQVSWSRYTDGRRNATVPITPWMPSLRRRPTIRAWPTAPIGKSYPLTKLWLRELIAEHPMQGFNVRITGK
jgi:hypothetical protein